MLLACLFTLAEMATARAAQHVPQDLMEMSLEALMEIEVTSSAKRPQKKSEAAAAIFVITGDDLRRWGVSNIPDALRRVPGLQVARINDSNWAITARGFNSRFANKLLVLIDGRSVYTPLFAGVYWESNEVMLEDVERIEIIRGPGGTLWGANAVNGVINIITRSAVDTQGTLVSAGIGNEEKALVSLRHGNSITDTMKYRVYGKFRLSDSGEEIDSGLISPARHDDTRFTQGGFRMDWENGRTDSHTLQGDLYRGHTGQHVRAASLPDPFIDESNYRGGNLLYRWAHRSTPDSDWMLQAYIDSVSLNSDVLSEDRTTFDIEFQQHRRINLHELIWGLNYRLVSDHPAATQLYSLDPPKRSVELYTGFIQDEISLPDKRLKLTLGSKFENNAFTGFEVQPNIRLTWLTERGNTLWGAVSRAVRTPARGEHDVALQTNPEPPPLTIFGSRDFASEKLVAYELGYRFSLAGKVSVDIAAFHNRYDELRTIDIYTPDPPLEARFDNNMKGNTQGIEIDARWHARTWLTLNANYTRLEIDLDLVNGSMDLQSLGSEDASPQHQANIWVAAMLGNNLELDAALRYVDSIENPGFAPVDSYIALDLRLGWQPRPGLEFSLSGQNLLESAHQEFNPDFIFSLPTQVERSITGKLTLEF